MATSTHRARYFAIQSRNSYNVISLAITGKLVEDKKPILQNITSLQYARSSSLPPEPSPDDSTVWTSIVSSGEEVQTNVTVILNNNEYLYLRGSADCFYIDDDNRFSITSTEDIYLYGNIFSLLYFDRFNDETALPADSIYTFRALFKDNPKLISAANMYIPAITNMQNGTFQEFFRNCETLREVPFNDAQSWGTSCYQSMFQNCVALNQVMTLPSVKTPKAATHIMCDMYNGCSELQTQYSSLESIGYSEHCFERMFKSTKTKGTIKFSQEDILQSYSCAEMFSNCKNLTTNVQNTPFTFDDATVSNISSDHACYKMYEESNMQNLYHFTVKKTAPNIFESMAQGSHLRFPPNFSQLKEVDMYAFKNAFAGCTEYDYVGADWASNGRAMSFADDVELSLSACEGMYKGSKCTGGNTGRVMNFLNIKRLGVACFKDAWREATIGNQQISLPIKIDYPAECFSGAFAESTANLYDTTNTNGIQLIASSIGNNACFEMFKGSAQEYLNVIVSTTSIGAGGCESMFENCAKLVSCPGVASNGNIDQQGCQKMFASSAIKNIPRLYINGKLGTSALQGMFTKCNSLNIDISGDSSEYTFAQDIKTKIPRNVLSFNGSQDNAQGIARQMFQGCANLKNPLYIESTEDLKITNTGNQAFFQMFQGCTELLRGGDIYVTALGQSACQEMYSGCTALTTTGIIDVIETLGNNGCQDMYKGCTNLATALSITAATCGNSGCQSMYMNCGKLQSSGEINFNIVNTNACKYMFRGCSSLQHIPNMKINYCGGMNEDNRNGDYCFHGMFMDCTGLETLYDVVPMLKIITPYACFQMFKNCKNLKLGTHNIIPGGYKHEDFTRISFGSYTNNEGESKEVYSSDTYVQLIATYWDGATELSVPAIKLAPYCFSEMFAGCSSTMIIPNMNNYLSLAEGCFSKMFYNCTALEQISSFTPRNYKPQKLPLYTVVNDKIEVVQNNGTVVYSDEDAYVRRNSENEWELCSKQSDGSYPEGAVPLVVLNKDSFSISILPKNSCNAMFANCTSLLQAAPILVDAFEEGACNAMFLNCKSLESVGEVIVKRIDAFGAANMFHNCVKLNSFFIDEYNVNSLFNKVTQAGNYAFLRCFMNCYSLTKMLPINLTNLSEGVYAYMYANCDKLEGPITLGSDSERLTIGVSCCSNMFRNCNKIAQISIYCNSLQNASFENMFMNCRYLTTATLDVKNTSNNKKYSLLRMFYNCIRLSTITYNCPEIFATDFTYEWLNNVVNSDGKFYHHTNILKDRIKIWCHTTVPTGWELTSIGEK